MMDKADVVWLSLPVVFIIGMFLYIWMAARRVKRELRLKHGEPVQYEYVSYDGQESLGCRQWRGLSILWLTRSEIILVRLSPPKKIVIPLENVLSVYPSRVYNGNFFILPWLCIRYIREDGKPDVIGCRVPGINGWNKWMRQIQDLRRRAY